MSARMKKIGALASGETDEHAKFRKSPAWLMFRRYMIAKHGSACELCGKVSRNASQINLHHRYITDYTNLSEHRFMVLCRTCHDYVHIKYSAPKYKSLGWFGLRDCTD